MLKFALHYITGNLLISKGTTDDLIASPLYLSVTILAFLSDREYMQKLSVQRPQVLAHYDIPSNGRCQCEKGACQIYGGCYQVLLCDCENESEWKEVVSFCSS